MTTNSSHNTIKWGGAALFVVTVAVGAVVVYQIQDFNKTGSSVATSSVVKKTVTPSMAPEKVESTPATVTNAADLASVDKSLDTTDLNQITSDLSANDQDLASF